MAALAVLRIWLANCGIGPERLFAATLAGGIIALAVYSLLNVGRMTPPVLRFVPAMSGTLMIPAVYFLAVQMVSRRAAPPGRTLHHGVRVHDGLLA